MRRRNFLTGIAAGSAGLDLMGQEPQGTVYIPKPQLVEDRKVLLDFMDEFSFATLITAAPDIRVTHIPVLLDRGSGQYGRLLAHVSANNPQHRILDGKNPAVVVFRGPHRYISPNWYTKQPAVPTWNFAVVHASGRPKANTDKKFTLSLLEKLIAKFESYEPSQWDFATVPDGYKAGLIQGIVAFEMDITQLEGKFKLGIDREADFQSMLKGLKDAHYERNLYEFTTAQAAARKK